MSGQRGSLGLSIAGGKGSLPYKNHDEVSTGRPVGWPQELVHYLSVQPHRDEEPLRPLAIHLTQNSHFPNVFMSVQGIFFSRVVQGGASEKAGIHVGDRLLEVEEIFLLLLPSCVV